MQIRVCSELHHCREAHLRPHFKYWGPKSLRQQTWVCRTCRKLWLRAQHWRAVDIEPAGLDLGRHLAREHLQGLASVGGSQCARTPHYPCRACSFTRKSTWFSHPPTSTLPNIPLVDRNSVCERAKRDEIFPPVTLFTASRISLPTFSYPTKQFRLSVFLEILFFLSASVVRKTRHVGCVGWN